MLFEPRTGDAGHLSRLLYLDDSGSSRSGLIIYGWVDVAPSDWARVLRVWLELRKELYREFGVRASEELHCTEYINGRGRISAHPPEGFVRTLDGRREVLWKDLGRAVAERCLEAVRDCADLEVGVVYARGPSDAKQYGRARYETYYRLLVQMNCDLRAAGSYALISMDGKDGNYQKQHRRLPLDARRIIEDPMMHDSRHSQWTQMADLVAYCANVMLDPYPGNAFGHRWYQEYLACRDPRGGPVETDWTRHS